MPGELREVPRTLLHERVPALFGLVGHVGQPRGLAGEDLLAYQAVVTVQSAAGLGSSARVTVDFDVEPAPPSIVLDVQDVSFSGVVGGQVPAVQQVGITNGGGGVLGDLSTSIAYGSGEPNGWLRADLAATEAPTQLTLQASVGLLQAGTYHASVEIRSSVASDSPQTLTITFEVAAVASSPPRSDGGVGDEP